MKFTLSWLKDHLETDATLEQILDALNDLGLEVESVENPAEKLKNFTVAHIKDAVRHPNADKLQVCTVLTIDGEKQIVCGAANARAGLNVALATPGTYIPGLDITIKQGNIRGIDSMGMLCSAEELGLTEESEGIIELPANSNIGDNIAKVLGLNDPMIEISITPNRPDALGVYGIARDLAARGLGTLKPYKNGHEGGSKESKIKVHLQTDDCPHFVGCYIENVQNKHTPDHTQKRMQSIGLKPISALVDITNYISYDYARPLHVFDADKIEGDIIVRSAKEGETLLALDEKIYTLSDSMMVIADEKKILAIAGIMGGLESGVTENTKNVFLESAYFDPISVATTGRKLNILSDARYRFERGIDPNSTMQGAKTALNMLIDLCGGSPSKFIEAGKAKIRNHHVDFNPQKVKKLSGLDICETRQKQILECLGFKFFEDNKILSPEWRPDIDSDADLVEEIIRIEGINKIEAKRPTINVEFTENMLSQLQQRVRLAKRVFASRGSNECINYSFIDEKYGNLLSDSLVKIANPISSDLSFMRPNLIAGLLNSIKRNQARGFQNLVLHEVGQVFEGVDENQQFFHATILRQGNNSERHWANTIRKVDAYDAKADLFAFFDNIGLNADSMPLNAEAPHYYHPKRSGTIQLGKNKLAFFGELHPKILKAFGIKGTVVACEIILNNIPENKKKGTARSNIQLSNYQAVHRDFAFIVDDKTSGESLIKAIRKAEKTLIKDIQIFDIYQGDNVENGKKSIALSIILQSQEKTLDEKEIETISSTIIENVAKATGAILRDG
jgi:phenylalanyl-tRNA synthetase beta chain